MSDVTDLYITRIGYPSDRVRESDYKSHLSRERVRQALERLDIKNKPMNKKEYFEFAEQFFKDCLEISKKKNADYTGGTDNPFSNFSSVEVLGISTEQGFLTRMMDKMKRIASFVEKGELQVKDESVIDTLNDLANYSALFAGYIKSKK